MNENLNLVEILKDCPMGMKLYSCLHGEVEFCGIVDFERLYPIMVTTQLKDSQTFTSDGRYFFDFDGECMLFPSKDNRDWSTFVAPPKEKIERFDPYTLKPFDQILVRDTHKDAWTPQILSYIEGEGLFVDMSVTDWKYAIPYKGNERLALCSDDPEDEFYRYWED